MKTKFTDNRGFIVVLLAGGLMILLCALAGLAIDVGRGYYVKGEVKNAADAAALAGAGTLFANPPLATDPNFDVARATAIQFVEKNQAAGTNLTAANAQVETGYWDLDAKQMRSTPSYSCAGTVTSCTPGGANPPGCACQQRGVAAVRVTVQKPALETYFAKVLGWRSTAPTGSSVAARGFPTSGKVALPFVVTKCITDYYMQNNLYGQTINIPQPYPGTTFSTGNWCSLGVESENSNKLVQDLITGGLQAAVSIGDSIMAQQGTRENLYRLTQSFVGRTVTVPVVADCTTDPNTSSTVTGFMEFTITDFVLRGSNSYISGTFQRYYEEGNPTISGIGGTPSNTLTPPLLVQ
jgi:Flp pilus assembly protein TadG